MIEDFNVAYRPDLRGVPSNQVDMLKAFIDVLNREDFRANFTVTGNLDHSIESIYCGMDICALRKKP